MNTSPARTLRPRSEISATGSRRVILFFIDGVGIGSSDPRRNPLAAVDLPHLQHLTGGPRPLLDDLREPVVGDRAILAAVDATLGMEGLPQSGTGQTALLTGINAAQRLGRHFGPWVPTALRPLLATDSLFRVASQSGLSVGFANAYPREEIGTHAAGAKRPGAFPFAASAAGMLTRDEESVRSGSALVSSISTERWARLIDPSAPIRTEAEWGALLVRLSTHHDLTIFAHYDTDYVGHRGDMAAAQQSIRRIDRFIGGMAAELPKDTLLLMVSDHGNIEEVGVGHTRNPVIFLSVGNSYAEVGLGVRALTDVMPSILGFLGKKEEWGGGGVT